jgi:hypothetical protein
MAAVMITPAPANIQRPRRLAAYRAQWIANGTAIAITVLNSM